MIFAKYWKKAVRREILVTIQTISLSRAHVNLSMHLRCIIYIYCMMSKYQDQLVLNVERIWYLNLLQSHSGVGTFQSKTHAKIRVSAFACLSTTLNYSINLLDMAVRVSKCLRQFISKTISGSKYNNQFQVILVTNVHNRL